MQDGRCKCRAELVIFNAAESRRARKREESMSQKEIR